MKSLKKLALPVVFFATSLSAFSQNRTLTIDEAVRIAVENNRDVEIARLNVRRADAAAAEQFGNVYPTLNITGNYTRNLLLPVLFLPNFANPNDPTLMPREIGSKNAFNIGGQVNQVIFNSAVFQGIETSKTYSNIAREQMRGTVARTIAATKRAFYAALYTKEVASTARQSLQYSEENLRNVRVLYREGVAAEFDQIRAEVATENIRPQVLQADAAFINAKNALKLMLGMDESADIDVSGDLTTMTAVRDIQREAILDQAEAANYDIKALELLKDFNRQLVNVARASYYPSLTAFGNFNYQGQANDFNFQTARTSAVGVQLNYSPFDGFKTQARVEQAQVDVLQAEQQLDQLRQQVNTQGQNIYLQAEVARQRVQAGERTVQQAQRGWQIAQTRYKAGTGNQLEISDAELQLRQARLNRAQAIYDYISAMADVE
ncbi:MAG TPA: TolC family protein, partial [Patescibacteria group bacterium]|nr:TolC family protein [Patescibacteria group bacterium]